MYRKSVGINNIGYIRTQLKLKLKNCPIFINLRPITCCVSSKSIPCGSTNKSTEAPDCCVHDNLNAANHSISMSEKIVLIKSVFHPTKLTGSTSR